MKVSQFKDYSELPLFLNAELVATVLGVSPSRGNGETYRVLRSAV